MADLPGLTPQRLRGIVLGIAGLAVAVRLWMAWTTHATGEDALITLRYAENIARGHGFVYNPGARVLGTTTPLYTLLLALAACLHLDPLLFGKTVNILAEGATCYLLARLLARPEIDRPLAGLFAALLYALMSTPISVSISGMETGLVTCAGLAAIHAYVARRPLPLSVLGALLFLLRIDTLLLFLLLAGGLAWQERRVPWRALGLAALLMLPWIVFACLYFGSPLPTSLLAKMTAYGQEHGASIGYPLQPENVAAFARQFGRGWVQRAVTLLFVVGAGYAVAQPRLRARLGLPLLWLALYYGVMLTSRIPAFGWYFLPPWPLFLGVACLGAQALLTGVRRLVSSAPTSALRHAWIPALLAVGMPGLVHLRAIRHDIAEAQAVEDNLRLPIGRWLRTQMRPDERILLEPIGYIGYYSRRRIVDMIGLVSPEVLPSYHTPSPLPDMVRRLHPEWLCLRPGEAAQLFSNGDTLLTTQYRLVREFHPSQNETAFLVYHRRQDLPVRQDLPSRQDSRSSTAQ
jgi:hypothetical protein